MIKLIIPISVFGTEDIPGGAGAGILIYLKKLRGHPPPLHQNVGKFSIAFFNS